MDRQVFMRFDEEEGYPDGITTDAEGALSVAVGAAVASAVFRSRA